MLKYQRVPYFQKLGSTPAPGLAVQSAAETSRCRGPPMAMEPGAEVEKKWLGESGDSGYSML